MTNLLKLLPFLEENELNDLVVKILSSDTQSFKGVYLKDVLCFLETNKIDELFVQFLKEGKDVNCFYPFVSEQTLNNIIELYCSDRLGYEIDVQKFCLFADEESVKLLYRYLSK